MKLKRTYKYPEGKGETSFLEGKDWQGKRFYISSPKGAYVNYKKGTYHKSSYDKQGVRMGEWVSYSFYPHKVEVLYELVD